MHSSPFRRRYLLNGWWDILPVEHTDLTQPLTPQDVPATGWTERAYLVPGFFTDAPYPESWRKGHSAWVRTGFTVEKEMGRTGERAYLTLRAAIPLAHIFVNGQRVAVQDDMFIGDAVDVTEALRPGENELAVLLTEFETFAHPESGEVKLIDAPWGCCITQRQAGLWQDVELEWRPAVQIADLTIVTSVRENRLTVTAEVANLSAHPFAGTLAARVVEAGLDLPAQPVHLAPGERRTLTFATLWRDYRPWSSADPPEVCFRNLYQLETVLTARLSSPQADGAPFDSDAGRDAHGKQPVDALTTRFGFRELWIEGHRLLLNGMPQRWYGEWCHKAHAHWLRPEYVRQWYQQLRDANMNYVRMHTFPHPEYFLDIADEMGILICQETALYGSFEGALDTPRLWPRATEHVRRMVRRDKNHPSLVIWSVENEMRWALRTMPQAKTELPRLRALFNQLDPTRPAFHEGDSGIWNEKQQPLISRHYGPACHGWGWWERDRPLLAGELGRWHYGSPYVALQWAGDEVYSDYTAMCQSLARDAARIIELGRANEVSCLFVWNTSGLDNYRPSEARAFEWPDPGAPYAKPLAHRPYESEYAWWDEGGALPAHGYRPGPSFEIIKAAQRPLAIVVWEERSQFYTDSEASHTIYVVNDYPEPASGVVSVQVEQREQVIWKQTQALTVAPGGTQRCAWRIPLAGLAAGEATLTTRIESDQGCDEVRRVLRLTSPEQRARRILRRPLAVPPVAILGSSRVVEWLDAYGVSTRAVGPEETPDPAHTPLLILGEHTVEPGSPLNRRLHKYVAQGGRLLVLEQTHSLFPGLEVARMPVEVAHIRAPEHPVVEGVAAEDLSFFGDDPFGLPSSTSWVTLYPYLKPQDDHLVYPIVDSSGGDFGAGGLTWAPVIEAQIGRGIVIAIQLRLLDRLADLPVADQLLRNALRYLADAPAPGESRVAVDAALYASWPERLADERVAPLAEESAPSAALTILSGARPSTLPPEVWQTYVRAGNTLVVWGLQPEAVAYWQAVSARAITLHLPEHVASCVSVYQLVRPAPAPLLDGISNEDTCWLENWTYRRTRAKEPIVERLATVEGGINLLENATHSALDVLFGDEKASEIDRMPTVSAYFDGACPELAEGELPIVGGGLVQVPVGDGQLLFCQMRWRPEKFQFRRFLGLLLWNLGIAAGSDILAGDHTPLTGKRSDGYPETLRATSAGGTETLAELLQLSVRQVEYCSDNAAFRFWPGWTQNVRAPGGGLRAAALPAGEAAYIGLEVHTPEPRKLVETVGGLPNPDLQTCLRLEGGGEVAVWVNGRMWRTAHIAVDAPADIADIDFEAGSNFVLLQWTPDTPDATLNLRFENKEHQPEITFQFI